MKEARLITEKDLRGLDAVLLDVREPGEFASEHLPGSRNAPLSRFESVIDALDRKQAVVVICRSGRRSHDAARRLEARGFKDVFVLEGGLSCCAPGSLARGSGRVWAMERQVRFAAGLLVLAGAALGWLAHPAFYLLSAGVGAGLVFSAATDTCGMARVLAWLPWNR